MKKKLLLGEVSTSFSIISVKTREKKKLSEKKMLPCVKPNTKKHFQEKNVCFLSRKKKKFTQISLR